MEENKTYSIVGTVTIGTDEYRDLIEKVMAERAESERLRSKWYEESSKNNASKNAYEERIVKLTHEYEGRNAKLRHENELLRKALKKTSAVDGVDLFCFVTEE